MQCPRCEHENPSPAKFCSECGAPLGLTCASCGASLPPTAKFCSECAHPVQARPAEPTRFASPQSYTPAHLAERIITTRSALEGERKQVSILFADLKGSMELLGDRDPEEARQMLDPVLERMMEAVHRYEGTVNQVMGDGIMALFGAPVAHEDHAVRACFSALRMQEAVNRLAEEMQSGSAVPLVMQIRVGINAGEVVVRSIGSDLRMDYSAVGQTTHLAARMEQMAVPGSILITAEVWRLAQGYVQAVSLGPMAVRGLETPVEIYELLGAGPIRSRIQASAARGLTRLVGRMTELEKLSQALDKAASGQGQVVAVVGEAGLGKSRLFWEFTHSPAAQRWLVLEGSFAAHGKTTPFLPIIDALKAYFQVEDRDDPRKVRDKVSGKLLAQGEALAPTLPAVLALLEVPTEDPKWDALDPLQRRQRTLEAIKRLFIWQSQVQPLMLIFEDLHWVDSESQEVLDSLVESLPTTRILLLVNYRPEYEHRWGGKSYYTQLGLTPMPPGLSEQILLDLLGDGPSLEPLKRVLIERTEGNPFFLEESVRTLLETDFLTGARGAYTMTRSLDTVQVPATVQAVLAARIDRLPADEKRLLQAASVLGKDVPFQLLQAIAEMGDDDLRRGLAHLRAAEFLYEARLFPELEYSFKHALTHEVAYQGLLHQRRRGLHARIVEAVEDLYRERLVEQVERLAYHAARGEVWDKTVRYSGQAGTKAAARSSYREAVAHFEQALTALRHLPEERDTRQQAIDLRFGLRNSLVSLGKIDRVLDDLREAEKLAEELGDRRRLGRVAAYMASNFWWMGEHTQAIAAGDRALGIAAELGDIPLYVFVSFLMGQVHHGRGDYHRAVEFTRRNVDGLPADPLNQPLRVTIAHVLSRTWLVSTLAELGEFREAVPLGEEGIRIAELADHPYSRIVAYLGAGYAYLRKGDFDKAIALLEPGLTLCQGSHLPVDQAVTLHHLGMAYALAGRLEEALQLLRRAVDGFTAIGLVSGQALVLGSLAEATLRGNRVDEARELAERALETARQHHERGYEAWALRLLGEVAGRQAATAEHAERWYREALTLAQELGMRPVVAHAHFGLGRLYRARGDRASAEAELATAESQYQDLEMRWWAGQAHGERAALA